MKFKVHGSGEILEGEPVIPEEEDGELRERFKEVHVAVNPIEWRMFKMMHQLPEGAPVSALATCLSRPPASNAVQVHIACMRLKFQSFLLPVAIELKRRNSNDGEARYKLIYAS